MSKHLDAHLDLDEKTGGIEHQEDGGDRAVAPFVPNPELERQLLRKIDFRVLPTLWVMYWLNYLDRSNIGNAKTAGLAKDLGLSSTNYSLAVSIFFAGYVLLQIPSNYLITRLRPRLYLPGIEFVWGCIVIAYLGVSSKSGLVALRFILGMVEAGFFPGVLLYLSLWYKKHELAMRYAIFYSASQLAGAFGGLLAGAILSGLGGLHGLPAWKWLFLIEGCMTVSFSLVAVFILPDCRPTPSGYPRRSESYHGKMAQYMTIPIYMVGLISILTFGYTSDRTKDRAWHLIGLSLFTILCLGIVAGVKHEPHARYAFLALGWGGIQGCVLLNFAVLGNSFGQPREKRAVAIGLINGVGNLASIYGSYIWPASTAPAYVPGFAASSAFMFVLTLCALAYKFILPRFPEKPYVPSR